MTKSASTRTKDEQEATQTRTTMMNRRGKRDKQDATAASNTVLPQSSTAKRKRESKALQKHKNDKPGGGMEALLPSLAGILVLAVALMVKMGFRGRASVAGIDLGTTNSVICVQQQSTGTNDLVIDCIPDPVTGSPVIPSVVSFLEASERKVGPSSKAPSLLDPHPSFTVVGAAAKRRIDSHPHHTLYNAKRVIGRSSNDAALHLLQNEVEFNIQVDENDFYFTVPETPIPISAQQVGSYVVYHLSRIAKEFLGHDNVKSAVICVPAKFNAVQRQATVAAFRQAGIQVARIVEEPTAAALAYGLHRKEGVDYILVYDFGGGTLDISLLHVSEGFVDVMGSDGDDRLGGADFDMAVARYLLEQHADQKSSVERVAAALKQLDATLSPTDDLEDVLSSQCPALKAIPLCTISSFHTIGEQLKIGLSEAYQPDTETSVSAQCLGLTNSSEDEFRSNETSSSIASFCNDLQPITLSLSSSEFSVVAQPLLDRSVSPITRLLKDLDLEPADIDEIVMVGGTTRMPQIRHLVQEAFSISQMNTHIDPDITVAYGAASVID